MAEDAVFVDNTTASADIARELYQAASSQNMHFIDARFLAVESGAENGKLTVMCGGDAAAFARAEPLMACYGAKVTIWEMPGPGN